MAAVDINLEIFKAQDTDCVEAKEKESIIDCCSHLKRLFAAYKYHEALGGATRADDKTSQLRKGLMVEFCQTAYGMLLDDATHLIKQHDDDVQAIFKELSAKYGLAPCGGASACVKTARHYGRRNRDTATTTDQKHDAVYEFYCSIFDRVHHFVSHLYDLGLRIDWNAVEEEPENDDELYVDAAVETLSRYTREARAKHDGQLQVENAKFVIDVDADADQPAADMHSKTLFLDAFIREVQDLVRLVEFVVTNEYDTASVEQDMTDTGNSNVANVVEDAPTIARVFQFVRCVQCMCARILVALSPYFYFAVTRHSFSTGFVFYYWGKRAQYTAEQVVGDVEYHSGLAPQELFVEPAHKSLKEEVLQSGLLDAAQWNECVDLKVQQYLQSATVKAMTAGKWAQAEAYRRSGITDLYRGERMHGIAQGSAMTAQHLSSMVLYCDCTALCTAFSETFRKESPFELMASVRRRHSRFAHFGRVLVETVHDFGINGESERGPFFTGLSCVLNVGSFSLYLKGQQHFGMFDFCERYMPSITLEIGSPKTRK